ncbi:MAG: AMMECR1 domain-containing protein, partial [Anaerolineales bacterium]
MSDRLTDGEKQTLLHLAREAMEYAVKGKALPPLNMESLTPALRENGASFVTLTIHAELRGCIGALEAHQPLAEDVREHAVAAALE